MTSKDGEAAQARLRIELAQDRERTKALEKAERQLRQIAKQRKAGQS